MFNIKSSNTIYKNYLDCVFYNLFKYIKKLKFKYKKHNITNIKFYFNLLTLKSNYIFNKYNYYLNKNLTLYYSVVIPLKISFSNLKEFIFNFNILNIPKINQVGDLILNGYSRISILYLKSVIKYIDFKFNNLIIKKYIINLKYNYNICLYFYNNNIYINLNNKKLFLNLFNLKYNNLYFINNTYDIINIFYLFDIFKKKKCSRFKIFNNLLYFNNILYEIFYIEVYFIIYKFLNIKLIKKLPIDNNNLINKATYSIVDSLFYIVKRLVNIYRFINSFKYLLTKRSKLEKNKFINTSLFRENFLINPLIHYTNQLNILSYLHNKYKINIFGYSNSINIKFSVSKTLRNVQQDYLGLINILYTVDGESCGLLSTLTNTTLKNKLKLKTLTLQKQNFTNILYFDISSKNLSKLLFNNFINIKKSFIFKTNIIEVLENNEFKIIKINKHIYNNYFSTSNLLSITELIIPFLLHNDPCRSLMGSKMHSQALPLIYSNNSYIFTKYNEFNNLLFFKCIISLSDGIVIDVTNYKIIILDNKNRFIYYYLNFFNINDYNSYIKYKPIIWPGEKVSLGQPLAVPYDFYNLEFTLGFNNLVNYNFYYGHEHEDAIIINKNLLFLDILTSINFDIYESYLSIDKFTYIELTLRRLLKYRRYNRYPKNKLGIFMGNKYIFANSILLLKVIYKILKYKYKWRKLKPKVIRKFFKKKRKRRKKKKRKLILIQKYTKIKKGSEGRLVKFEISSYSVNKQIINTIKTYLYIKFFIARINKIKIGDKLCGRHGNKGVISKITESINLPYTSFDLCPSIITSPIGAFARMNLGQFLEGTCGNLGFNLNLRIKSPINLDNIYLYSHLYFKSLYNFFNKYNNLFFNFLSKIIFRDFKTGYKLKNFTYFILLYYFKLMHTSKSKFQYRTLGRYSNITQQPVKGKSKNGGQKFGEMEVWSLEAHGTSYNLREMTLLKTNYKIFKAYPKTTLCSNTFKILTLELKNILLNININKIYSLLPFSFYSVY
uniref:DNA-directed RNA polymerase subunit beta n=1 Tax=Babesia duncani TaxID=323732 RepID=A0A385GNL1_9APIC|nr:DNA-directed RNA polymerase beta subunit [Babesia duncani]